jgi:hypothetical protein
MQCLVKWKVPMEFIPVEYAISPSWPIWDLCLSHETNWMPHSSVLDKSIILPVIFSFNILYISTFLCYIFIYKFCWLYSIFYFSTITISIDDECDLMVYLFYTVAHYVFRQCIQLILYIEYISPWTSTCICQNVS